MSGYSDTPLWKKLGYKPGLRVKLINQPANYWELVQFDLSELIFDSSEADFVHAFVTKRTELEHLLPSIKQHIPKSASVWISWPKGKSKIPTDLNENIIREAALANGLVDVKVCAVDEDWSGLKLVYRLKDR